MKGHLCHNIPLWICRPQPKTTALMGDSSCLVIIWIISPYEKQLGGMEQPAAKSQITPTTPKTPSPNTHTVICPKVILDVVLSLDLVTGCPSFKQRPHTKCY